MLRLDQLEQPGSTASGTAAAKSRQQLPVDPQLGELLLDVQAGLAKAVRGSLGAAGSSQVMRSVCVCVCSSGLHG